MDNKKQKKIPHNKNTSNRLQMLMDGKQMNQIRELSATINEKYNKYSDKQKAKMDADFQEVLHELVFTENKFKFNKNISNEKIIFINCLTHYLFNVLQEFDLDFVIEQYNLDEEGTNKSTYQNAATKITT
jgi:hypothetical protein